MLDSELTTWKDSIEEQFCVPLSKMEFGELTEIQALTIKRATRIEEQNEYASIFKGLEPQETPVSTRFIQKSLHHRFTFTINDPCLLILSEVCATFGDTIMILTYIQYKAKQKGIKHVTAKALCQEIFPFGFPTKKSLEKAWEMQKVKRDEYNVNGSDNLLDYPFAMKSIQFDEQ